MDRMLSRLNTGAPRCDHVRNDESANEPSFFQSARMFRFFSLQREGQLRREKQTDRWYTREVRLRSSKQFTYKLFSYTQTLNATTNCTAVIGHNIPSTTTLAYWFLFSCGPYTPRVSPQPITFQHQLRNDLSCENNGCPYMGMARKQGPFLVAGAEGEGCMRRFVAEAAPTNHISTVPQGAAVSSSRRR